MSAETRRSKYCTFLLLSWRSSCREKERDRSWEMFPLEVIKWLITTGVDPPPPLPPPPPTLLKRRRYHLRVATSDNEIVTISLRPATYNPTVNTHSLLTWRPTIAPLWTRIYNWADRTLQVCSTVSIRSWNIIIIIIIISSTITRLSNTCDLAHTFHHNWKMKRNSNFLFSECRCLPLEAKELIKMCDSLANEWWRVNDEVPTAALINVLNRFYIFWLTLLL